MLRSLNSLLKYKIMAKDGPIGHVHDFFFDDHEWVVRYLVDDTGTWLPGRQVLISPFAISQAVWTSSELMINLTQDQVKHSPEVSSNSPVSRQKEEEMAKHFGWPVYWGATGITGTSVVPGAPAAETAQGRQKTTGRTTEKRDPHLNSIRDVTGYHIEARDGSIGHVEDFIADDERWAIRYLVADLHNWLPGKKVLIAPKWIEEVKWADSKVHLSLDRERIQHSPHYDPSLAVNRQHEERLYDYYGRPKYWA